MEHVHSGNQMIDPQLLFEKAGLQPGMHVADLGCGQTGHIIFPASKILGEFGIVYGVDIVKEVLEIIHKRAILNNLLNIQTVWSDIEKVGKTSIPKNSLDIVFLVNTLVQAVDRHAALEEAKRLLKDKSRLIVVDWIRKGLKFGPSDDRFVDFQDIKKWGVSHGFVLQEEFSVGQFHHGLVFYKHE